MDQISPSDFDQQFELENPFDLVSGLLIESLRNDALQDALVRRSEPTEVFMTTDEVAAFVKRSPNTIRQWCRLDTFPYIVLPGKHGKPGDRLFSRKWIVRWLEERGFNVPEE
jgi:hypothetical protein